jgi:hypothetical protein
VYPIQPCFNTVFHTQVTGRNNNYTVRQVPKLNKVHFRTGHEGREGEQMYSSIFSLTSALDGVVDQSHAPAASPQGETQYPLNSRVGGPQDRSGQVRRTSISLAFDPRTAQPVASRLTDCAIPALYVRCYELYFKRHT